jgi:hypothetical protein
MSVAGLSPVRGVVEDHGPIYMLIQPPIVFLSLSHATESRPRSDADARVSVAGKSPGPVLVLAQQLRR